MSRGLSFVTYNIRKGKGASGWSSTAFDELGHALAERRPDLVLAQEVFHAADSANNLAQQSTHLAERLGMNSFYEPNKHRRIGHHGNATVSRYDIVDAQNYDISTNWFERRGALYVKLDVGGSPLHVLNVHLGLNQRQRVTQVQMIADIVGSRVPRDEAFLLAGDFNDWNRVLDPMVCEKLGVESAVNLNDPVARTWPSRRPVFCLDRIYTRNLAARSLTRLHGPPWIDLSDHLPLWAEIEL